MLIMPAKAKVNLCLAVLGRRADGFHDIDSVAVAIDWHDLVGVALRPAAQTTIGLLVTGPAAGDTPAGADNLAVRAAHAVMGGLAPTDVRLWLEKRLPPLAGLGGGSADAAAVLRACAAAAGAEPDLAELAASLGSDVPVALAGGIQRMRGRGEQLESLAGPELHLTVAVAGCSDTAASYRECADFDHEDSSRVDRVVASLRAGRRPDEDDLGSGLEAPASRAQPLLDERLTALRAAIPEARWHLTGSGGAVFSLAEDAAAAAELAGAARAAGYPARACRGSLSG